MRCLEHVFESIRLLERALRHKKTQRATTPRTYVAKCIYV